MPYTVDDVERHKKGLSPEQKEKWVAIANAVYEDCMAQEDVGELECAARAIRIANSQVGDEEQEELSGEELGGGSEQGDADVAGQGVAAAQSEEAIARSREVAIQSEETVAQSEEGVAVQGEGAMMQSEEVVMQGGKAVAQGEAVVNGKVYKTVDGELRPPEDFLVVEDPEKPSTWHLPVKVKGKLDRRLMGAAWAALMHPRGYRGRKYEGPQKEEAIRKLKALYKSIGEEPPSYGESLPPHRLYVESTKDLNNCLLLTKQPSEAEVLNIEDEDLANVLLALRRVSDQGLLSIYNRLRAASEGSLSPDEVTVFQYALNEGNVALSDLVAVRDRLAGTILLHKDPSELVQECDASDTLFVLLNSSALQEAAESVKLGSKIP